MICFIKELRTRMKKILSMSLLAILIVGLSMSVSAAAPKLNKKRIQLRIGEKTKITATQKVEWFSSDDAVVTVDQDGRIKTHDYGTA